MEVGRVSKRTRFNGSSRSIAPDVVLECSSSDEQEIDVASLKGESRGLPEGVDAISGSLGMEIGGLRWFLSKGKHDNS